MNPADNYEDIYCVACAPTAPCGPCREQRDAERDYADGWIIRDLVPR